MLINIVRGGSAVALCLALAPAAWAQGVVPPAPGTGPVANDPSGFRISSVMGAQIQLQGGSPAGTVSDVVLTHEGVIEYLIVNNGGKLVTVPWEAAKFNWQAAAAPAAGTAPAPVVATLSITPQQYQAIPVYTTTTYPNFYTPTYRTEVYKVYGLTPGQVRRIERR
jgi:hypothetical protein